MSHPIDGELRAFLDEETSTEEGARLRRHLETCPDCRDRREELLRAEAAVGEALEAMRPRTDVAAARRAVRRRLETARGEAAGTPSASPETSAGFGWRRRAALARAAAVVLLLVGGVAAGLPGSPVRQWLGDLWSPDPGSEVAAPASAPAEVEEAGEAAEGEAEIRVQPAAGTVRIALTDTEPGTRVRIILVEDETAGVVADAAARFRSGPGRMEVSGAGGEVRVEIPRSVTEARVTANDRLLFLKDGSTLTLPSADPDTAGAELLFRVPPEG